MLKIAEKIVARDERIAQAKRKKLALEYEEKIAFSIFSTHLWKISGSTYAYLGSLSGIG